MRINCFCALQSLPKGRCSSLFCLPSDPGGFQFAMVNRSHKRLTSDVTFLIHHLAGMQQGKKSTGALTTGETSYTHRFAVLIRECFFFILKAMLLSVLVLFLSALVVCQVMGD